MSTHTCLVPSLLQEKNQRPSGVASAVTDMANIVDAQVATLATRGASPWKDLNPEFVRQRLRRSLAALGVPNAKAYGTQDFRRGHAEDMRRAGCSLAEILANGAPLPSCIT